MRTLLIPVLLVFLSVASVYGENGLIAIKSSHSVKKTVDRLESVLKEKGMTVFTRVNHTDGAEKVGLELRPTELLIFGNPKVGTPLMQCSQSAAIDLPQKALVYEDQEGQVWLTYNDPHYLANRHKITGCDEVIKKIENALKNFSNAATRAD
ncbi:MAG: DUF302 domain-containing protein [Thermodesulfobacteriota bacterium]